MLLSFQSICQPYLVHLQFYYTLQKDKELRFQSGWWSKMLLWSKALPNRLIESQNQEYFWCVSSIVVKMCWYCHVILQYTSVLSVTLVKDMLTFQCILGCVRFIIPILLNCTTQNIMVEKSKRILSISISSIKRQKIINDLTLNWLRYLIQ